MRTMKMCSDRAGVQADLSLRLAHTHFIGLSCRGSYVSVYNPEFFKRRKSANTFFSS